MAEKERPLYTLYKGLKANNFDVPDNYDSFERTLTEAGNGGANSRHTLYNSLKEQNFDVPDTYERFYSNLFTPVNKNTSRALGGAVPMSAADKARFSAGAAAISAQAGQAMRRAKNTQRAAKLKQQQEKQRKDFGRIDLGTQQTPYGTDNAVKDNFGVDPVTGKAGTYITSSGEEIGNEYEAGQQQQAEDKFNDAYNAAVDSGAIPSAFDVVDKDGNYDLYENVGKNGVHVTEQGEQNQLDAKINYANERLADIKARIAEIDSKNGNPLLSYQASIGGGSGASEERRQLGLAKTQVEAELRSLNAVRNQPDRNFLQNGWQGFADTALTAKTWDFGLNDFALMAQMEHIKTKIDNNVPLTNEEKRLAQSKVGADAAAALADKEMGKAYRWSGIAGQSVPFMLDFYLTGGFGGLTHAAGKAAVKYAAKKGMGAFGKNVLKYTGVTAANIVGSYAMAGTEQAFKTGADIMNRHMGTLYQDEDGNYKFGTFDDNGNLIHDGGEGFGTALYKGLTAAMLENYTEKVFRHTHFKRATSKAFANHFPKFASFLATKGAPKWMKRLGIDGLGEEIMEEEINIPLNSLLVGDNKLSDLGDLQQQGDIIFGIGLSVGAMYAINSAPRGAVKIYNSAQYYKFKNAMGNVDSRLQSMMGDRWADWKDKIDNTPNEKMGALTKDILQQKQSGSLNEEEINTIGDYISNLAKVRGYNLAKTTEVEAKEQTGEETTPEDEQQQEQEQAYAEGQDAEGEEKHEIQMQTAEAEGVLASMLGVSEDQLENIDLDSMLGENDDLDLAIYDYQNSQARYQGVMDNAQSKVDAAEKNAVAEVRRRTDTSRGTVRNATIKSASNDQNGGEDYGVFIVSGNIAQNEDGTINTADSDQMILYFDPLTGKIEHGDASRFASIGEEVDAELATQQAIELARQDAIAGVTRDIDGKIGEGIRFVVTDNQGQQHVYEVLADNGDGTASISIDGNVMENVFPTMDELQKMKDDSDKQRIANTVATKQAEREKQQAAEEQKKQEAEEKVNTIDFSQLIDPNGTITTATIEGEEDKLGFVVGYTPSGKLRIAYLNEDGTVEKRKGLVSPDKVMQGEPMAVDEYKTLMGEQLASQSTNSEVVDESATKEVEGSGLVDEAPAEEPEPIGTGVFGNIYNQFKGKVKDAFNFLMKHKSGDLLGVFHRDDVGDIDLVWGDRTKNQGIDHIIDKHIERHNDFSSIDDAMAVIDDVINNGTINDKKSKWDKVVIEKDGYSVVIRKNIRDDKGNVINESKNWVVTAFESEHKQGEKKASSDVTLAAPNINEGSRAVAPDEASDGKDNKNPSNDNEEKQTLTFADGTPVPMLEDGNPDFSKMTAEQAAELYDSQFGEDAEQILSNSVADAKKVLDKAKSKPIKGKNFLELTASKSANDKAVAEAQAAYDNAKAVSNAYQELLIDRSLGTVEGRQNLLDKAKRKYDRLKNTDEWKDNQQALWDDTVGKVLHRLYDNTSVDVFDPEPRTVEEYVSSNLAPFSLNYEGSKTAKGVKQETGLERKDFAKSKVLAAEGKGQTVDAFVHKLWQNRPPQLESATDQDIRNAVIGLITGNMNAYDMRHVIENNRIAEAEKEIEDEQTAAENAAYQEEQRRADEEAATAENNAPIEEVPEEETAPTDSEAQQNEQQPEEQSPEDAADNMPFGEQLPESDLPFSPNDENKVVGSKERKEMVDKNKVTVDHVSEAFIPKKLQRGIARIAKMMPKVNGKPLTVQYLYSADADGWFDRDTNTLYLALDSSKALQMVFGHEMTHAIKSMNTSSYDELKGLVKEFLGEDFDKAVDATEQFYNAHGVTYPNREDYEEEVIADGIGTIINDLNLTKGIALRMSHPLLAAFHNILMKIRLAFRLSDDGTYERLTHAVKVIEKAYVDTMKMDAANVENTTGEQGTAFSIRQKPDPEKTIKCYKLMRLGEDGKLYPLFIDAKAPTELGIWYDGDSPNLEQLKGLPSGVHLVDNETGKVTSFEDWYNEHTDLYKKGNGNITKMGKLPSKEAINWATLHNARFMYIEDTKRGQNRFGGEARKYWNLGINGSGTVSTFSMRPGWHAGSLPTMRQIGKGKDKNLRDDNFVWVEGEISADIDYNEEAQKNPDKDIPNRIPEDGYYLKATNANKSASQADRVGWYVAGAFKANRIMGDAEARKVIDDWNANHPDLPVEYDYERESGMTFNADTMRLEDKDGNPSPKFSLKVYHGSGADFDEFDFDHMGEGAGSQAFGWGGYVTSSKNIGKSYATLMDNDPLRSHVVIRNASARRFIKKYPTLESFLHSMADKDNLTAQEKTINKHFTEQEKIDYYNERAKDAEPYHNLYEVEIPDDNGKNYLDWYSPVTEELLDKVAKALPSLDSFDIKHLKKETVHDLYDMVSMRIVSDLATFNDDKAASKFFSSLGYTGIKYPAGTIMGGAKKGDTNYVIFKPEDMNIASHTKFSIRTYHGSQASFDKFDHSFMGSGEGAQAYGWGTYVSEVEGIAKAYARQNAKKNAPSRLMYQGKPMTYKTPTVIYQVALDMDRSNISAKEAISKMIDAYEKKLASVGDTPFEKMKAKQVQDELNTLKGLNPSDFKINEDYDTVAQNLADVKSGLSFAEEELKNANSYVELYQSRLNEAKENLEKAKASGTGLGVDMYEGDVEYYNRQVERNKKKAKTMEEDVKDIKAKVDALQKKLDSMEKPRNLYTVEIPDDTGDNYIDWDHAITEKQHNAIIELMKSMAYKYEDGYHSGNYGYDIFSDSLKKELFKQNQTGGEWYRQLESVLGSDKLVSKLLQAHGIDGVKVIAKHNTGGDKDGRMNYVIFDEDNAKIVNHTKFSLRGIDKVNKDFNDALKDFTLDNADKITFHLGMPSNDLLSGGVANKPLKLYGSKLAKKIRKHDFEPSDLIDLPKAMQHPIAVFNNHETEGNRSVLTELKIKGDNVLVSVTIGKGQDADINIISSTHGKRKSSVVEWFKKGLATFINNKKAQEYLHLAAPIAAASNTDELSAAKISNSSETSKKNGENISSDSDIRFSLKDPDKTMFGMHNISVDKLRKAIKQGGFAAPSMGVVDSKNGVYSDYGEITLIPKAEKLDKRKGKNAGTFTADAWTPTYPQVITRQTKEGRDKLYADTLVNYNIPGAIGKNLLNRWESYINTGSSRPSEFAWQYMFEKGMNPKVTYSKSAYPKSISNKVMKITDNGVKRMKELTKEENGELIKLYNAYLEKKGEGLDEKAVNEIIGYLEEWKENEKVGIFKDNIQRKIDYFKEYGGDINKAQDWAWKEVVPAAKSDGKVNHAMTLYYATIKADSDKKMQSDLQKWFDGKLQEYGLEEYLYNGETASGNPKYVPNTVENAVKIMKKQGLAGGYNDFAPGVGAFIAKYAPTANTLAAMKKNKDKLIPSGDERHKEVRDMILNEYNGLARSLTIKPTDAFDDSGTYRMQELADVKPKDLKKYIADNWNKEVSDGWIERYNELVDTIKNDYPVYYFETKFMRPYGLDEFEKAIVPKNTPTDVMDALKKSGIDVRTYEGKEDREKVTMDALAGSDGIMFSLRYSDYEKSLSDWKKRNGLPKDAKQPEMPQQQPNESKFDYMKRVNRYLGEKALWKTAPTYEGHLLFGDTAVGYLNSELQRGSVLARIAMQDSMLAVRKAQEGIMKELGLDKIGVGEDAYTAENRSHGKGKNEFEEYNQIYLQPLRKAYHVMKKLLGNSYDNVKVYMMSKHGLERNAFIAFREALKKDFTTKEKGKKDVFDASGMQKAYNDYKVDINRINNDADYAAGKIDYATYRQNDDAIRTKYAPSYPEYRYDDEGNVRDYAGLSALYSEADDFEIAAAANVKDVEDAHNAEATALWDATNASTKKILKDSHLAGMMSKSVYDYVKGMYNNYIPLRGWDGTSADQVWDYVGGGRGAFNQTMKKAGGRKSIADDPIAYIENMAESGILLNNKNWVKQHLLLLAENHPTSMLSVSKAWYVKSRDAQGNEIWTISSPNIPSDMTDPEKISQAIAQFDNDMRTLEVMGEATQKRGHLDIVYPQTKGEEREHEVRVLRDGEEYVIYVNGDPQLAQAMNNVRAQRVRENQTGLFDRTAAWIGRKMAAAYTSLSPLFIPANFTRDLTMTLASTAIREDGKYNYLLRKNFLKHWDTMPLVIKYQNGKLKQKVEDGSATDSEKMFYEFMMNGGETGFVTTMEVEDFKKKIQKELKDMDRWKANPKRVGHAIMDSIELLNRAIEDSNRYLVYMTSRQYGRPIEEAINNAKDVTLNFNRKGTGEYGWQMVRNLYLFINPAIQSLQTLGALAKNHPYKFTAVTSLWLASGAIVPVVNSLLLSMFGDDDDKDKYWSFSKWDRRNNFIMWIPGTKNFVKIPLAQEFRGFYAVGDMIASKLMGGEKAEESWSDYGFDLMGQVVDMLPLDPTGYDGNVVVSLMPNAMRPIFELAFNVDFTGKPLFNDSEYNKYDPNFTKAYVGTPDWLVRTSKLVNSINNPYPDVQQNAIDRFGNPRYNLNNPAVVDHVLSSYLGGAYTFGSQAVGVLTKALNADSEIKVADIPLLSRFAANPDDRPVTKKQGDAFWTMKEQQDRTANTLSKLKKEAKAIGDFSTLEGFYKSDQYAKFKENAPRIKQYEEDKKKEKAEKDGEEYKTHKVTGSDIYKKHASSSDDFEDMKMDLLWKKVGSYKTVYDGMVSVGNSQSESYYGNHAAVIDAADEAYNLRSDINGLKKGMITDDGKDGYNADDMKQIRELRKQAISILENAAKSLPKPEDK